MAKFSLRPTETLIGSDIITYFDPYGFGCAEELGRVYVTNERLIHCNPVGVAFVDLPLSRVSGFKAGRRFLFIPKCTIYTTEGDVHIFADFRVPLLLDWLQEAGVPQY